MMNADILTLKAILVFFTSLILVSGVQGQVEQQVEQSDSTDRNPYLSPSSLAISGGMISAGMILNQAGNGQVKINFQDYVQRQFPDFHTNLDDFLQWAPALEMGIANLAGVPATHQPFHQATLYTISIAVNAVIVQGLKEITGVTRPNGGPHAFPSGHTSNAFVNATVLYLEYRDNATWLAWSGYLFASATGMLRIMNNAHWVSDVLAGAGTGILITQLVYSLDYRITLHSSHPQASSGNFTLLPVPGQKSLGFYFSWSF